MHAASGVRPSDDAVASAAQQTRLTRAVIAAMAALALGLTLYQLSRPSMLFGISEYDDGAYFGSAIRFVHGALPYRDFVLVQPPGFMLLASPLALLSNVIGTQDALAVARLFMPVVAALNVVLVGLLMRHRGPLATLVAAGLMAVFPAEVHASHTLLLEPLLDLFCLVAAVLIFDGERMRAGPWRLLLGGLAFGFAGTIKGWAVIPVVVVALLCLADVRRRLAPLLGGVVLGIAVPTLPFALTAPSSFYREVVSTQVRRVGGSGRVPATSRLADLTGSSSLTPNSSAATAVGIAVLVALAALLIAAAAGLRRRPTPFELFVVGCLLGVGALLSAPAEFYDHYAAFFAPFLAMGVGGAVGLLAAQRTVRVALALAAVGVVALAVNQARIISGAHGGDLTHTVGVVVPAGACALSDSSAYLITIDRFVSAQPGCADNVADPYGTTISNGGTRTPATTAVWLHAIADADYVVLYSPTRDARIPETAPVRALFAHDFTLVRAGTLFVYVRHGFPVG